jgi:hypothetical protein
MDKGIALALLVVGLILLYTGYTESQSVSGKFNEAISGGPTNRALIFYCTGAAATAFGGFRLFKSLK